MEHTWIAISNDYESVLDSLNDEILTKIAYDFQKCTSRDSPLFEHACDRFKQYVIQRRGRVLTAALTKKSRQYIRACPCSSCRYNEPCVVCERRTPFNITSDDQKYTFTLCRGGIRKHVCVKCYITNNLNRM